MRRPVALLSVVMLLVSATFAGAVSAAVSTHVRLSRTGATVSFAAVHDGLWITTELSASSEASRDVATGPLLWINQGAYAPDETGEYNVRVWSSAGETTDFAMTIDSQLASASVSAPAMPITVCDADYVCTDTTSAVEASFTAVGGTQHSHQRSVGSVSHESMFVYNNVGSYRFAIASVAVDGVTFGPSTGPSDASIYDTRTGTIDVTRAAAGATARPAGVTVYDTTAPLSGRQTGDSLFANWLDESGPIGHNTVLSASSQRFSSKGTVVNQKSIYYADQVYSIDEFGYITPITYTFSGESGTATTISVDRTMSNGVLAGAVIPATSCTYIDEEALCVDTVVQAAGQWTGIGATTKTRDGGTAGVAGVLVIVYRYVSTHRDANATATIDGVTLSGAIESFMDRTTTGFHEVHIGN
jgi:hypothetical protein